MRETKLAAFACSNSTRLFFGGFCFPKQNFIPFPALAPNARLLRWALLRPYLRYDGLVSPPEMRSLLDGSGPCSALTANPTFIHRAQIVRALYTFSNHAATLQV